MNSIRGIVTPEIQKFLQQKENEFNVEIATKSDDVNIAELKKEFEGIKEKFRELVLSYLRTESTDQETLDFLLNDSRIKNLMEGEPEYNIHLYKTNIIKEGGKIYDENYQ